MTVRCCKVMQTPHLRPTITRVHLLQRQDELITLGSTLHDLGRIHKTLVITPLKAKRIPTLVRIQMGNHTDLGKGDITRAPHLS